MPIDTSIYGMVRGPAQQPGPLDEYAKAMTLRSMIDQQGLHSLQRRKLEQEFADDEATRAAYTQGGGDPVRVRDILAGQGLYRPAQAIEKIIGERREKDATIGKTEMETFVKGMGLLKDRLPTVRDEASYQEYRQAAASILGPQAFQRANLPPSYSPDWVQRQLVEAKQLFTPKLEKVGDRMVDVNPFTNPSAANMTIGMTAAERDASARGWAGISQSRDQFNRGRLQYDAERGGTVNIDTGEFKPATQGGVPIGPKDKDPNDAQGKAILFGSRMSASDQILRDMEAKGIKTGSLIKQGAEALPLVGGPASMAANFLASGDQQAVEQAQRDFINAVLRRESGAVISEQEFSNARKQYFGQPGDSPETLRQKQQNRALAVKGMETEAGRHAPAIARNVAATRQPSQSSAGQIKPAGGIKFLGYEGQ